MKEHEDDVSDAVKRHRPVPPTPTNYEGIVFGRVTKIVGAGHIKVGIVGNTGMKELLVRIPNVLGRRGATPLNTSSVVSVYVGVEFNPIEAINPSDHFDITSILEQKQAYELQKIGLIPSWMVQDTEKSTTAEDKSGFEFDYSEIKEEAVTDRRRPEAEDVDIDNV
jgi:hypothetical protein